MSDQPAAVAERPQATRTAEKMHDELRKHAADFVKSNDELAKTTQAEVQAGTIPSLQIVSAVASDLGKGMYHEITEHPLQLAESLAIGAGTGVVLSLVAPEAALVAGAYFLAKAATDLALRIPDWIHDGAVVGNPMAYSAAEMAKAHSELQDVGAGTLVTAAAMAGGAATYFCPGLLAGRAASEVAGTASGESATAPGAATAAGADAAAGAGSGAATAAGADAAAGAGGGAATAAGADAAAGAGGGAATAAGADAAAGAGGGAATAAGADAAAGAGGGAATAISADTTAGGGGGTATATGGDAARAAGESGAAKPAPELGKLRDDGVRVLSKDETVSLFDSRAAAGETYTYQKPDLQPGNPKYYEVSGEQVYLRGAKASYRVASTESPIVVKSGVQLSDGTELAAGTRLPPGVKVAGDTIVTPPEGITLADGTVLRSGTKLPSGTDISGGQLISDGDWVVTRGTTRDGKPGYDVYTPHDQSTTAGGASFQSRWKPVPGQPGQYSPRSVPTTLAYLPEGSYEIPTSWGTASGKGPAFLAKYGEGDYNIITAKDLTETYGATDARSEALLRALTK